MAFTTLFAAWPLPAAMQESPTPPSTLRSLVEQAEMLVKERDMTRARTVTKEAWMVVEAMPATQRGEPETQEWAWRLGHTSYDAGDLQSAHAAWLLCMEHRARTLPDTHLHLRWARSNLAECKRALHDLVGALELQEKVLAACLSSLPDDHPDLQTARGNLAATKGDLGDLKGARELQEKVLSVSSKTLSDDHPDLQTARGNLAAILTGLGDLTGAKELQEKVLGILSRTLPGDHPDLQTARGNLAVTRFKLGDFAGAMDLQEKALAVWMKRLPAGHTALEQARRNLSVTKRILGDLAGARRLQEKALAGYQKTLPDDHEALQLVRISLANTKSELGDIVGARELREKVLAVYSQSLPDEHPALQMARHNLAVSLADMADWWAARELQEEVLSVRSKMLSDEHPDVQSARGNLAMTLRALGQLAEARDLQDKVLAVGVATLPDEHPDLQAIRGNLASTKADLGDLVGARELQEKVLAVYLKTLPDKHWDVQRARYNLGTIMADLGDWAGAQEVYAKLITVYQETLPDEHPHLQVARHSLTIAKHALNDLTGAREIAFQLCRATQAQLASSIASPRELIAVANAARDAVSCLLSIPPSADPRAQPSVPAVALMTSQALQGIELRAYRRQANARRRDPARAVALEAQLQRATTAVQSAANPLLVDGAEALEASLGARYKALAEAVRQRDAVSRELLQLAGQSAAHVQAEVGHLAAKLPSGAAAVAVISHSHSSPDARRPGRRTSEERLTGFVLSPDGTLSHHALGLRATADELIQAVRLAGARDAATRGSRKANEAPQPATEDPTEALRQLGAQVFAPLIAALPKGTKTIVLSVDDSLDLLPLDTIVLPSDKLLGDEYRLELVPSLLDLLEDCDTRVAEDPVLVAFGGVDFGSEPAQATGVLGDAAAPGVRAGEAGKFAPLTHSKHEVERIANEFAATFAKGQAKSFFGRDASKHTLAAMAPSATFVHLATHGFFSAETVKSMLDRHPKSRFDFGLEDRVSGLSPYVLTGLALAGANLQADELGHRAGIITAEEVTSLDLSNCYLATLSACETSLGVRRAGQSFASLRGAFQAAGARYVLTSLWTVGDRATKDLMADFYRRLWQDKQNPSEALWAARSALRTRGAEYGDWAGWVLTGR